MRSKSGELGAAQLDWCRKKIRTFDLAWKQVEAAKADAAKTYKAMGVEPGAVETPT